MSHWLTGSCHSVCAHPANLSFLLIFSKKHQRLGIWLLPATSCAFTTKLTRLAPKSAVFCLLRLSGTLSVQSLAPLWSLIVSLLEAVFTSHFATKYQWTYEKTGDHFPQLTRCVKWNDWSILVTMWIFTQGKPKIAWGETLLSDFFISLSDLFTQAREHSQNNRSFHLMCRVDCQNKSKCHADEITGLLDVCRPNDKTPDWWQRNEIKTINPKLISQKSVKEACPNTMQWRSWEDDGDHEQWQQQRQQATALFVKQWTVVIWCSQQLLWKLVQKICWVPVAWGFVQKNMKWYFHVQNERISEAKAPEISASDHFEWLFGAISWAARWKCAAKSQY